MKERPDPLPPPRSDTPLAGKAVLYVVATPIGNLEDITLRGLRVLKEADWVAAEDTRHTRNLLAHFDIHTSLVAHHQHSSPQDTAELVRRMTEDGQSIALVTDAGTPGVSDPGIALTRAAIDAGVPVVPVPGASAVLAALTGSGLPTARFAFEGFLPRTKSALREKLNALAREGRTLVFYEAANRTADTLKALADAFGPARPAAVGRELTKAYEEFVRGTLTELAAHFASHAARGEVTIVVGGLGVDTPAELVPETLDVSAALRAALESGLSERDAVRQVTVQHKLSRRDVYAVMLALKPE